MRLTFVLAGQPMAPGFAVRPRCRQASVWISFKKSVICASFMVNSTMDLEVESRVVCPYCGAVFTSVIDTSAGTFSTIEDCEICCRPIAVSVHCHCGEIESVEFDRA
jgi:hypothetical protein